MKAIDFYNAKATNVVNVPRPEHPEDPSGIAGVHRAIEARFFAKDALVMSLAEACQFAEAYACRCRHGLTSVFCPVHGEEEPSARAGG